MLGLQGFWLNLDRCGELEFWMQSRLGELGLSAQYQRVAGVEGDAAEASCRGLKPGEWGAWQGWIRMLDCASQSTASVVPFLEDDVDISDSSLKLAQGDLLHALLARQKLCVQKPMFPLANVYPCFMLLLRPGVMVDNS